VSFDRRNSEDRTSGKPSIETTLRQVIQEIEDSKAHLSILQEAQPLCEQSSVPSRKVSVAAAAADTGSITPMSMAGTSDMTPEGSSITDLSSRSAMPSTSKGGQGLPRLARLQTKWMQVLPVNRS
jgi:hypothetical protein